MGLNIIKPQQCSLERSHVVLIELKESLLRPKKILKSSRNKNFQNHNNEDLFRKYIAIYRIKSNADNKTQSFKM